MAAGMTCVVWIFKSLTPSRLDSCFELRLAPQEVGPDGGRRRYIGLPKVRLSVSREVR
jgi:hypothetical protein